MVRLGFAADVAPFDAACFAHRAFCARLIFLQAAADIVRVPFDLDPLYAPTNAVRAAFSADNCFSTMFRSLFNSFTIPDQFAIECPLVSDCTKLANLARLKDQSLDSS
jgi:hypothetical protein